MKRYNPSEIEPKWQKTWAEARIYEARAADKPKKYILEYFPYPSGAAMHVGHVRNYTIGDTLTRHARMNGYNVLHPMGWDAFGLPAENYAIKTGISPQQAIKENTAKFKQQLTQMGFGYDWSREFASSDPEYYKWTQWFFLLLFKKGLAYRKESPQWWCPVDKTVLANEQVENGRCWRCGSEVEKKALQQWFFKITDYADRLERDLDELNWSDSIKNMQRNWIGRSVGAEVDFVVEGSEQVITVYTTRIDTLYGATFIVLAPEHPIIEKIMAPDHERQIRNYQAKTRSKSDIERQETDREKTGVFTGRYAVNPVNGEKIPIWVADYVLYGYGTGAIMAVPAHDDRDYAFAAQHQLPLRQVIEGAEVGSDFYGGEGRVINSDVYDELSSSEAREKITTDLAAKGQAREKVNYKIRDWLISRQRYWGAPIPVVHCEACGIVPVPEDQLPIVLPEMSSYEPSGDGRSPLARVSEFVNTACPQCGGPAERETDTMDGFACSSWYFLRFADPHNSEKPFDEAHIKKWLPVDDYIGGAEHAVMHLLYARMWTKVMYDEGLIDFHEPFKTLRNQGMILAPDGRKMSKSWGNVIAPDDLIAEGYGADAIRIMELFIGPWNQSANWSVEGMGGAFRFLQRVWTLTQEYLERRDSADTADPAALQQAVHRTIKKVNEDLEELGFNTAIAAMMELVNELYKLKITIPFDEASATWKWTIESLLQILAPFAPHITEELWQQLGNADSIHTVSWPSYDEAYVISDTIKIVIQVNGKLRGEIEVAKEASEAAVKAAALSNENVKQYTKDEEVKRIIYVPGRLVNIVL